MAVEEEVHPGHDDLVQVATVKTTGRSTRCTSFDSPHRKLNSKGCNSMGEEGIYRYQSLCSVATE